MKYIIVSLFAVFFIAHNVQAEVIFIANKNVAEKSLSADDIKEIFLGNKNRWQDNTKIHFVISGNEELHQEFLAIYINKSLRQYVAYWRNKLFTGKGTPPKMFKTNDEVIEYVARTQGAIGYIDSSIAYPSQVSIIAVK